MNRCVSQLFARKLPAASGSRSRGRLMLFFHSIMAVMGFLAVSVTSPNLKAADNTVTNMTATTPSVRPPAQASAADVTNRVNVLDDKYNLAIGDQLSFQIIEDEDDPVHLVVTDSGDLQVPYLGRYPAVDKTCKQLAQEVKVALEKEYYLRATVVIAVDLKPKSRGKIYLAGAISAPGPQDISGDEALTVSKAILRAGGLTSFADGKDVKVTRATGTHSSDEKAFIVNVSRIYEKGKTEEDLPLQPGDFIFVPERMIRF